MDSGSAGLPGSGNGNGNGNGKRPINGESVGRMTLMEAAQLMERLQGRAAHTGELEALRIARDALLTIVSEGFVTLKDRLKTDGVQVRPASPDAPPKPQGSATPPASS